MPKRPISGHYQNAKTKDEQRHKPGDPMHDFNQKFALELMKQRLEKERQEFIQPMDIKMVEALSNLIHIKIARALKEEDKKKAMVIANLGEAIKQSNSNLNASGVIVFDPASDPDGIFYSKLQERLVKTKEVTGITQEQIEASVADAFAAALEKQRQAKYPPLKLVRN